MTVDTKIDDALKVLTALGLPRGQQNERSALCLLALLNLGPKRKWAEAENPLLGITPMMEWVRENYGKKYAPNTRETFRRQTMHQFVEAGVALYNPDNPMRPVNSPHAVYQVEPVALRILQTFGSTKWEDELSNYLRVRKTLLQKYSQEREMHQIPVQVAKDKAIQLSPGDHSRLIKAIVEEFAPRYLPDALLVYVGDTGDKWAYCDEGILADFGITAGSHGKMPDVVFLDKRRGWLVLVESVTSHGPVDGKRHDELKRIFEDSGHGLIFVTAFPNRSTMVQYLREIAWETEVWVADSPTHLIHFDGERFLGPYSKPPS